MLHRRRAWLEAQPDLVPERLVFNDETGASTKTARRYGRARRGERCRAPVPHGHWKTTTFVGALRPAGMTAPLVLDGALHGGAFLPHLEHVLVPTLTPGDIVILDHLPAHHPVAAAGNLADSDAGVSVLGIAVIAGLNPLVDKAITANGEVAGGGASVGVDGVAVVTGLAVSDDGVTTNGFFGRPPLQQFGQRWPAGRSEERRVGTERRSRWSPYQ